MEKLRKFSFLLAVIFILAALSIKLLRSDWPILYANILTGLGIVFFLLSLYFERQGILSFFSARSTRHGLNTFVMALLVLAIVVVANWIISRHPLKYDSTKDKSFTLSSLTVNALKNLKQPVRITAFYSYGGDDASRMKIKTLLDDYKRYSGQLQIRIIDPKKNLPLVRQYGITTDGTTVIESGTQKTTINSTEEEEITNSILKVSAKKQVTIYFLQGHKEPSTSDFNETGLSAAIEELKKSNYAIKELGDLAAKAKIPDDCDSLIIVSPSMALLDHEIKAIQDFLDAGGRALVLDDPNSDPSIGKLLSAYKITAAKDIVVDEGCNFPLAGPIVPCAVPQSGTPVTKEFDARALLFFPQAKSLSYQEGGDNKITYTKVLESSDKSWGETDEQQAAFDEGKDAKGPLTLGIIATRKIDAPKKKSDEMRLAVYGDASFTQNQFINWSPWNYQLFSNTIAYLTEQENLIHLPPKSPRNEVMTLSNAYLKFIWLSVIVILPLAVLATGIIIWARRKKL